MFSRVLAPLVVFMVMILNIIEICSVCVRVRKDPVFGFLVRVRVAVQARVD